MKQTLHKKFFLPKMYQYLSMCLFRGREAKTMNTQSDPIIHKILTAMTNLDLPPIKCTPNTQRQPSKVLNTSKAMTFCTDNSENQKNAI